jgi:chemotaxis protein histidine kinase CheA
VAGLGQDALSRLASEASHRIERLNHPELVTQWGLVVAADRGPLIVPVVAIAAVRPYDDTCIASGAGLILGRHAGRTFPVLGLAELLGRRSGTAAGQPPAYGGTARLSVLVLEHGESWAGLLVHGIGSRIEYTMKPLGRFLGRLPGFAGTAVLVDGAIAFVLSPSEVVSIASDSMHD